LILPPVLWFASGAMALIRQELAKYGKLIAERGLTAGAGGNISAREGRLVWVKPSGFAMDDVRGSDMFCVDLETGRQIEGRHRPTSELPMHLAVYKKRSDVQAVFHTHSHFASGVISSGTEIRPMFAEVVGDLGEIASVPYLLTSTDELAQAVACAAERHNTIFMENHGVVCLGHTMKQAYFRCCVAEDAAKSYAAAAVVGTPRFLSEQQIAELKNLESTAYRARLAEQP
jgi:L-fuculose-phosphate aldolase